MKETEGRTELEKALLTQLMDAGDKMNEAMSDYRRIWIACQQYRKMSDGEGPFKNLATTEELAKKVAEWIREWEDAE